MGELGADVGRGSPPAMTLALRASPGSDLVFGFQWGRNNQRWFASPPLAIPERCPDRRVCNSPVRSTTLSRAVMVAGPSFMTTVTMLASQTVWLMKCSDLRGT